MSTLATPLPAGRRKRRPRFVRQVARWLLSGAVRLDLYRQLELTAQRGMREGTAVEFIWRTRTRDGTRSLLHPISMFCEDAAYSLAQEGRTLADIVLRWAGDYERPLLVAAATTGIQPELYAELCRHMQRGMELRQALRGLLINIATLLALVAAAALFIAFYFVPELSPYINLEQLRGSAGSLVRSALVIQDYWPLMLLGGTVIFGTLAIALPKLTGPVRDWLDGWEPFLTYRQVTAGGFIAGAAALMQAGLNERETLRLLRQRAAPYLTYRIRQLERIDAGFGDRLHRLPGDWPDYETKVDAAFAAEHTDAVGEYTRMGQALIQRTVVRCQRWSRISSWLGNFVLAAIIIWILLATNDVAATFQASQQ